MILMVNSDLEKVFNVPRILNLPFSNVSQTIKFGSKGRKTMKNFTVRYVYQGNNKQLLNEVE